MYDLRLFHAEEANHSGTIGKPKMRMDPRPDADGGRLWARFLGDIPHRAFHPNSATDHRPKDQAADVRDRNKTEI